VKVPEHSKAAQTFHASTHSQPCTVLSFCMCVSGIQVQRMFLYVLNVKKY
jgi:uncharacterized FAD-dependent dehydrogenase